MGIDCEIDSWVFFVSGGMLIIRILSLFYVICRKSFLIVDMIYNLYILKEIVS